MNGPVWVRFVFAVAALYDMVLGVLFPATPMWIFAQTSTTPPNHPGYVQFPALLLIVFGLMFAAVARNPTKCRLFILPAAGLKLAYCLPTIGYWAADDIALMFKPFAVIDLAMLGLFLLAWHATRPHAVGQSGARDAARRL